MSLTKKRGFLPYGYLHMDFSSTPQAKKQRLTKVLIAVVTMTMMKKVATPQHGGGHVAIDNRAGCRHVQTRGRPVHQQGLRR